MSKPKQEKIIDSLVEQTRSLLEDHWAEAERVFAGIDQMKIGVQLVVDFVGADATCKVTIGFGSRIKDSSETTVHDQPELSFPESHPKRKP
jgi:hypothetical protein